MYGTKKIIEIVGEEGDTSYILDIIKKETIMLVR
jgi:hypothetical protein